MADFNNSPSMTLPIPTVSVAPGPEWASLLNSCLTIIDGHSHVAGSGVPITPDALDINSDLPMNAQNLVDARSLRMSPQGSPLALAADIGCIYVSGVDLYYNDVNGNQVRITQSGAVSGTPGSISNLVSPASAAYVAGTSTFVWQSAANTPANMDAASLILRNLTSGSNGLTLQPPAAMGSNSSITLPTLPASQKFLTLDASGNMAAPWEVDNASIEVSANVVQLKDEGVTQEKLALRTSGTTVAAGGVALSASSGSYSSTAVGYTVVTNLSVTITTLGRPVRVQLVPAGAGAPGGTVGKFTPSLGGDSMQLAIYRDGVAISESRYFYYAINTVELPCSIMSYLDLVPAGTYTYEFYMSGGSPSTPVSATAVKLLAYEI